MLQVAYIAVLPHDSLVFTAGRQWKKFEPNLREILDSFRVG